MSGSTIEEAGLSGRRSTILLVEDEELLRLSLADYLRECGFEVVEACSGDEAVAKLRSTQDPIDLVFSDIQMPGALDGIGLAQWIKQARPGIPVVLASGDAQKSEAAKLLCECEPFFAKPYDFAAITGQFRQMIKAAAASL
jgi:CheY-like chemotaxis protein